MAPSSARTSRTSRAPARAVTVACALAGALAGLAAPSPVLAQRTATDARAAAPRTDAERSALVRSITGFAFDNVVAMGVGGFMTMRVVPVVLFRDGTALTDVEGLGTPGGLAASRAATPDEWTTWRRAGDRIELFRRGKRSSEWKALPFRTLYTTLPAGFRLDGAYRSLGGGGDVAMGGGTMIAGWRDLRFFPDGRVERGGGSGGTASGGGGTAVFSSTAATRAGRYAVEGLELVLRFDDGTVERRIIVTDPADPSVLWLDGTAYTQRKAERRR